MFGLNNDFCAIDIPDTYHAPSEYTKGIARWCPGCGDFAVLTAVQNSRHPPDRRSIAGYAEPFRRASHRAACVATALQIIPRNLDSLIGAL